MAVLKELGVVRNDLQPYVLATIKNKDGTKIDLTGATIRCNMRLQGSTTLKINRQTAGIVIATDQVANKGEFEYQWQSGDTDTSGTYDIRFEISPSGSGKFTLPGALDSWQIVIVDDLDAT